MTEIELATQRQLVLDLKVKLQKAKDAARVAKEVFKAAETASYEETEAQLVEEVAKVCRDYYAETWAEALNRAGVLANFKLRRAENIFFPEDIWEVQVMLPPPVADPIPPLEQLSITQAPPPDVGVSTGARKDMEVQPLMKAKHSKDDLTIRDVISKAKDAESKSKARDSQSEAADPKNDSHQAKA